MPTYTNSHAAVITVDDVTFGPSEEKQLYNYIDLSQDTNGFISLTSDAPYFNPLIDDNLINGTDEDIEKSINYKCSSIRIVPIYGTITMYLNSKSNTPGMTLVEAITLNNKRRINNLIFTFTDAGEILIQENA